MSVIIASFVFSPACSSPAAKAKGELTRRGLRFSASVFLERVKAGDIEAKDPYGVTALMFSFITGSGDAALKLMEMGADVNARDDRGASALRMAKDNPENVKILKEAGATE